MSWYRARLVEQLAEVQASIDYIDWKQGFYDDVLAGRTEDYSNLCLWSKQAGADWNGN